MRQSKQIRACTWILIAVGQLTSQAIAQPPSGSNTLKADEKSSRVYILVDKVRLGHAHAIEGNLKIGKLKLGAKEAAGQLVFDMETFDADTEAARKHAGLEGETDSDTQRKVNDNMLGPKVLDVKEFPTATFEIDSSLATGKQSAEKNPLYELKGHFTLHGKTHPLTAIAEAKVVGKTTRLSGKFKILQTDYDIKPYSAAFGAIAVADELTIWGEIDLKP
jgi:polyisoprenoid-binding protein YceI